MSHSYGSFSGRDSHGRRNEEGERNEKPQAGSMRLEKHGRPRDRDHGDRPRLKGKEIGLYYRDKARARAAKAAKAKAVPITIQCDLEDKIKNVLKRTDGFYNSPLEDECPRAARDCHTTLEEKYGHINDSQFKRKFFRVVSGNIQKNLARAMLVQSSLQRDEELDRNLLEELRAKLSFPKYKKMLEFRTRLPAYQKRSEILDLVRDNQVVLISGETGCGKTTQVAQFLLDDQIEEGNGSITRIVCTQPRRICAIAVAERVAAERAENLGASVGFQVRLEKVPSRDKGSILFCTTGLLLQFLQHDPALRGFSHIVLDEIHERSTESDFIIALLKLIIPKRPDLKVLLMSATLNSESFSKYYDNCPTIHIPGFTYPVTEFYLEDVLKFTQFKFSDTVPQSQSCKHDFERYKQNTLMPYLRILTRNNMYPRQVIDQLLNSYSEELSLTLIESLIRYICHNEGPGAILVFLPGMMDIIALNRLMVNTGQYPESRYIVYPLHSRLPTVDQKLVFEEPPDGKRKIIIATSIAETSITIEDVVYVIDSGRTKLLKFDIGRNLRTLRAEWVSLSSAKQRRGRAGRVKPGYCYHLYTKARETTFEQYPLPEMLRTSLEMVVLQIKILQLGTADSFLVSVMDPPNPIAVRLSIKELKMLNALDDDEQLTPLGYHLAQLPLHPKAGKMIIWAALFSCVDPVFAIAASLTFKDAFHSPLGKQEEAAEKKWMLSMEQCSDHIAFAEALRRFEVSYRMGRASTFCRYYFLSFSTLKLLSNMKSQFAQHLHQMQFLDSDDPTAKSANRNSNNIALVRAIVCAGLFPNIAIIRHVTKNGTRAWTAEDGTVNIHPSSVNHKIQSLPSPFITYFTKQRSSAIFLHDTTCVSVETLLFAAPNIIIKKVNSGWWDIDIGISNGFPCKRDTALLIQKLRVVFNNVLEYKLTHPGTVNWSSHEGDILNVIIDLLCQGEK